MSINKGHPDFVKFIRKELHTVQFLKDSTYIQSNFSELSTSASTTHSIYAYAQDKDLKKKTFEFEACFELHIEKQLRKVLIEVLVEPDFSQVSYLLAIFDNEKFLRKFHFDYAIKRPAEKDLKPIYHLQYGGKESPYLRRNKIDIEPIFPWLSSPRISYTPINLALLLDMVFCEFKLENTHGLSERDEWRNLIMNNEEFVLTPFYKGMNTFLTTGGHKSSKLIRDFYYGS